MYMNVAVAYWRRLLMQDAWRAFSRAWAKTGNRMAARMAIMAITTSSSIKVKPRWRILDFGFWILDFGLPADGYRSKIQNPKSKMPWVFTCLTVVSLRSSEFGFWIGDCSDSNPKSKILLSPGRLGLVFNGVQVRRGGDEERAVGGYCRRVDGRAHVDLVDHFELLSCRQDDEVAVLGAHIHLPVRDERGGPDVTLRVVHPVWFAGLRIQAVDIAAEVGHVNEAIGDRGSRKRVHDLAITPDGAGLGDVPALGDVDAGEIAEPLAMLRVLPDRHIDPVLVEDRRVDDLAGPVGSGVLEALAVLLPVLGR